MALKNEFYNEIFDQEQKWIEMINSNLLNTIYCKCTLKPFYAEKIKILENEYIVSKNKLIEQIIIIFKNIISQIEIIEERYQNNKKIDVKSLLPLFLTTQMYTTQTKKETGDSNLNLELSRLQIRKRILENKIKSYNRQKKPIYDDYLYEDFPEN